MSNKLHNFEYDSFQKQAIDAVDNESSVLVSAPTGAGKTVIADYVIAKTLERGGNVIYTAPVKALSNQKYREFSEIYGDKIGIVTGDVSINSTAPVRIMTTEIYRNTLLEQLDNLKNVDWIIFDEVHYLDDLERGTVWEESIILTPLSTKLLCLSATVPNIDELADWMKTVLERPTVVVKENSRPVPLHFYYQCQNKIYSAWNDLKKWGYKGVAKNFEKFDRKKFNRRNRFQKKNSTKRLQQNRISSLMNHFIEQKKLPCIFFAFSRRRTEELAEEITRFEFLSPEEQNHVDNEYLKLCKRFDIVNEPSAKRLRKFVRFGIAFHHAGMLPTLKEVVEQLFNAKLLPVIFTTETFALGINMPARSVVFDNLRKYYSTGFDILHSRDLFQMAGRAGRRGMDDEGFVYLRLVPTRIKLNALQEVLFGTYKPVLSQFNASYATVLNLYEVHGDKIIELYQKTLHCFQASKRQQKRAIQRFSYRLDVLNETGCIRHKIITKKGKFACWMFGYELFLAELFESGLLDRFSEHELCFAMSCLVYEPRRGVYKPRVLPKQFRWVIRDLEKVYRKIHRTETIYQIEPPASPPHPHLAWALEDWLKGADFHSALEKSEMDEGEFVRYIRMVIQLLRLLSTAPHTSEKLRQTARNARKLIDRGVIDAERQLRS